MVVTPEVKARVEAVIKNCIVVIKAKYDVELKMPTILYTQGGRIAGIANYAKWIVNFNPVLLMENVEVFLKRTVVHELAHLACDKIYPEAHRPTIKFDSCVSMGRYARRPKREVHGPRWRSIMVALGADPSRCHSYDTTSVRRGSSFRYQCDCGKVVTCGEKIHNQIQTAPGSRYHCRGRKLTLINNATPVVKVAAKPTTQPAANVGSQPSSKLSRCKQLFFQYGKVKSKAEMIQLFVDEVGCTPAGAQTYWYKM